MDEKGQQPGDEAGQHPHDASRDFLVEYSRHQHTIHVYVRTLVPNKSDADDVMQEVSVALWRKWSIYDKNSDFRRWAFGVAYIEVLRHRRKSATDRLWFSEQLIESLADDFDSASNQHEARLDALPACLEKLGDEDRKMVAARYRAGGSVRDIADQKGIPASTVYKRLMRIRASLRDCISRSLKATSNYTLENSR